MKIIKHRVAVIGGGLNSAVGRAHIGALNLTDRFQIVAGCFSRHSSVNKESASFYSVESNRLYEDYRDLIENEKANVDCIIILTSTDQHCPQVVDCLNAGIPVICEKALTTSVEEALQIKTVLEQTDGFLTVIYNYLGYPMVRELRHLIEKGRIGRVQQIQVEMPQEGYKRIRNGKPIVPQEWRLKEGIIPMLSLDLGVHLHILIKYLTEEVPENVVAFSNSLGNFSNITDNINCIIQYSDNLICNMWYSKVAIGQRNGLRIRVYGETGSAEWYQENPETLLLANNTGNRWVMDRGSDDAEVSNMARYTRFKVGHPAGFIEALANYYEDISDELSDYLTGSKFVHKKEAFGISEALEGLKLFEAISKSAHNQSWQVVNNVTASPHLI